tara:strand:+ start:377 stop:1339 length:963 start_codon:yes stop_codon:yes gene_type:complete
MKFLKDVRAVGILPAIATIIKSTKSTAFILFTLFLACSPDYGIHTEIIETVDPSDMTVVVDSLVQPSTPASIDVLIVLDTSGSMSDNYEQVSRGVEILRGDIELITFDYQIAFVNSSLIETYFAGPYDVYSSAIDFLLAPWTLETDRYETAFYAAYEFTTLTEEGTDFFRPSADKLLIFISDEDEQSAFTADIFHYWLKDEFQYVQHDIVAIVNTGAGDCESGWSSYVGNKYIDLSVYYGKTATDICSDWELALADSTFLVGPVDYLNLSQEPVEDTIVVYVDKIITEEWYYLSETNTVYFDFEPPEGSLIEVGYIVYNN